MVFPKWEPSQVVSCKNILARQPPGICFRGSPLSATARLSAPCGMPETGFAHIFPAERFLILLELFRRRLPRPSRPIQLSACSLRAVYWPLSHAVLCDC